MKVEDRIHREVKGSTPTWAFLFPRYFFPAFLLLVATLFGATPSFAQWTALGPDGGGANLLAADDRRPGILLAGTRNALLYKSSDYAATWQPVAFDRALAATLHTLVAHRCNPDAFYAGTSDPDLSKAGVYRIQHKADSWTVRPLLMGEGVMSLAVAPTDCRVIAAGTLTGVMVSHDSGETWERIAPTGDLDAQPIVSLAFSPESFETLFAGTPKLPWKTVDGGQTWKPVHVGINDDSDIFSIVAESNRVLIGACSGIYRSADGGVVWQKVLGIPGVSRRTYIVKPDPSNPRTIYAGTSNGLWKSVNAGVTWIQKSTVPARSIVINQHDSRDLVLASDVGIWKSRDGGDTLVPSNFGFVNRSLGAFLDAGGGALLASAVYEIGSGTLFATKNGGHDWSARSGTSLFGEHIFHLARNSGYLFAAGMNSLFRSADSGKTWTRTPLTPKGNVTDLAIVPGTRTVLLATTATLYESTSEGSQWREIPMPPDVPRIEALKTSTSGATWGILSAGQVFLSSDSGATWSLLPVPHESGPVYDFVLREDQEVLVGTLRGLLSSSDLGVQWNAPTRGLPAGTVTAVLWNPVEQQLMFSVQNGIVWKSSDCGASWVSIDASEIGSEAVAELYWAFDYQKLYAVGFARGVFVQNIAPSQTLSSLKMEDK